MLQTLCLKLSDSQSHLTAPPHDFIIILIKHSHPSICVSIYLSQIVSEPESTTDHLLSHKWVLQCLCVHCGGRPLFYVTYSTWQFIWHLKLVRFKTTLVFCFFCNIMPVMNREKRSALLFQSLHSASWQICLPTVDLTKAFLSSPAMDWLIHCKKPWVPHMLIQEPRWKITP